MRQKFLIIIAENFIFLS